MVREDGISLAGSVESIRKLNQDITSDKTASVLNASLVALDALSEINESVKQGNSHPTCKPTKLMRYLITMICPPAGTVLDPFAGSCSTGVAAIETKREFIGIEREEEYAEQGEARLAEAKGENEIQNRLFQ